MAARTATSTTLSIDSLDDEGARTLQIERLVFGFERYLKRRRGLVTAITWRRKINKFLTTNGVTYDMIRARLETDLNLELTLTQNELQEIISS